jgi:glycosyltransferase involved in cell wall biosynthesis
MASTKISKLSMLDFKFSVLLPVFYKANPDHFKSALESLFNQSLPANEVVIVKDGPLTSELENVLSQYTHNLPLKVLALKKNMGLGEALHIGLLNCSYDFVARMDSDDICVRERFEKQVEAFLENPDLDIIGSYLREFVHEIGDLKVIRKVPLKHEDIQSYTFYRCPFNHPTVMFKKSAVLRVGSYKSMPFFEDYYLWIRMAVANCCFENSEKVLLHYRIGNNMISRRHGLKYANDEYRFFKNCYKEGFINAYQFLRFCFRFPVRLLPIKILGKFYDYFLRS